MSGTLQALEIEWAIEALRSVHHCDVTVLPRVLKIAPAESVDGAVIREALVRIGPRLRELRGDGAMDDGHVDVSDIAVDALSLRLRQQVYPTLLLPTCCPNNVMIITITIMILMIIKIANDNNERTNE